MKPDPSDTVTTRSLAWPRAQGRGSGKTVWQETAKDLHSANESLSAVIEGQKATIRDLEAEVALLRQQIAKRKPKGGRQRVPDDVVNEIERALEAGQSTRRIADRFRVSAMTVSRVRKRVEARQVQSA